MKKLIALILALVLVVGLCACGEGGHSHRSDGGFAIMDLHSEPDSNLYHVTIEALPEYNIPVSLDNVVFTFSTDKETFENLAIGQIINGAIWYYELKEDQHEYTIINTEYGTFSLENVPTTMMGIFDGEYCVQHKIAHGERVIIHVRDIHNELINFDIMATPELVNKLEVGDVFKGTLNVNNHLLNEYNFEYQHDKLFFTAVNGYDFENLHLTLVNWVVKCDNHYYNHCPL